MKALTEVGGSPLAIAAFETWLIILGWRRSFKAALYTAVNTAEDIAREAIAKEVPVAMSECGVASWMPAIIRINGAPNPIPARAANMQALVESSGWIVVKPMIPAVKIRNPVNKGTRIDLALIAQKPQTMVEAPPLIQKGCSRAARRKGSVSNSDDVLYHTLSQTF